MPRWTFVIKKLHLHLSYSTMKMSFSHSNSKQMKCEHYVLKERGAHCFSNSTWFRSNSHMQTDSPSWAGEGNIDSRVRNGREIHQMMKFVLSRRVFISLRVCTLLTIWESRSNLETRLIIEIITTSQGPDSSCNTYHFNLIAETLLAAFPGLYVQNQ